MIPKDFTRNAYETLVSDILNDLYAMGYEINLLSIAFSLTERDVKEIVGEE